MFTKKQQLQKTDRLRGPVERNFGKANPSSAFGKPKSTSSFGKKKAPLREVKPDKSEKLRPFPPKKEKKSHKVSIDKRVKLRDTPLFKPTQIKEHPLKDKNYLSWFHLQGIGCLVCGSTNIEAHHVLRGADGRPDDSVIPLCQEHHRGVFSPHGFESDKFKIKYPKKKLLVIAKEIYKNYKKGGHTSTIML